MAVSKKKVDSVRASRDGHEYHEAWVARKCLGLLFPRDDLVGISIEGFSPKDPKASKEATEIADAVLYRGKRPTFAGASSVVVVQVKYSKAAELKPLRAADAKKTLAKFATTYRAFKRQYGVEPARKKLRFELVTNRPVLPELTHALQALASAEALQGLAAVQAAQVKAACRLTGKDLQEFARRIELTALTGDLQTTKHDLAVALADWSPARDAMSKVRLSAVKQMVRDKAGLAHEDRRVITLPHLLAALEIGHESELLPCPTSFPNVGEVVQRRQLEDVVRRIPNLERPLLIHADGGFGKTVFINSIAASLAPAHDVVLFDCFGMGQYRAPEDARHLPRRGLVHIANDLAARGLCDPLLPVENADDLIRAFRARLTQAAETTRRLRAGRQVILLLDAIDNASEHAEVRREDSFPRLLLQSIEHSGMVPDVKVVVSARTHRRQKATGSATCEEVPIEPFTIQETKEYLRHRIKQVTDVAVQVAQSRSQGNARVLEHLVAEGPTQLAASEVGKTVELDDLLRKRIATALSLARVQGYRQEDISSFLAGLATLPPPVPIGEFAEANGISDGAVRSFAADMSPLLELTKHGLMFRDEPTEFLIGEEYAADAAALRRLADNLLAMQGRSAYAAATLPGLLERLDDGDRLFSLAFDERLPAGITSTVGLQKIRRSRLRAAIAHAARTRDSDRLVPLCVEMSSIAAIEQRGSEYLLDNPQLTVASGDVESVRRLFELRTTWPGTRHSRLAIAHALLGDQAEAFHHAHRVDQWMRHYREQDEEYRREARVEALDMAALPLCHLLNGDAAAARACLARWKDWFAFDVMVELLSLVKPFPSNAAKETVDTFISSLSRAGELAAAIRFTQDEERRRHLIRALGKVCSQKSEDLAQVGASHSSDVQAIASGLLDAAAAAVTAGMSATAQAILSVVPVAPPLLYVFEDSHWSGEVHLFLMRQVLSRLARGKAIRERDLLPRELEALDASIPQDLDGETYRKALKAEVDRRHRESKEGSKSSGHSDKRSADSFISGRLRQFHEIALAFADALKGEGSENDGGGSLAPLQTFWAASHDGNTLRRSFSADRWHHNVLCEKLLVDGLKANARLPTKDVRQFVEALCAYETVPAKRLTRVVELLARQPQYHALAGRVASRAKTVLEHDDDVDQRASGFGRLANAILPASAPEAVRYFQLGLEQMDAIGSGDYQFVNELMQFASEMRGVQSPTEDSHTLSNIAELNLGEAHKFHWGMYGAAMAKASGVKGLAKLARWEDRGRVSLDYTLLPFLRALLENGQMDPNVAVSLLRISDPAELYVCATEHFAQSLVKRTGSDVSSCLRTLIEQYVFDKSDSFLAVPPEILAGLAKDRLGQSSKEYVYLTAVAAQKEATREEYHYLQNWRKPEPDAEENRRKRAAEEAAERARIEGLAFALNPMDEMALADALASTEGWTGHRWSRDLLQRARANVAYADWPSYIRMIASHDELDIYDKLHELAACKEQWSGDSQAVVAALTESASIVARTSSPEFVGWGHLSGSHLKELSDLSGVGRDQLILILLTEMARPGTTYSGAVWLSLAAEFVKTATPGVAQNALTRLLRSGPAKLASSVADGPWRAEMVSSDDQIDVAAGLIWFALGSPTASRRWMAAHSVLTAARLDRFDLIDKVIARCGDETAGPFQAGEFKFFYSHARLWMLIALARAARDFPAFVARHRELLLAVVSSPDGRHSLFRHFAAAALRSCIDQGHCQLDEASMGALDAVDSSPFPIAQVQDLETESFYDGRSRADHEAVERLYLESDFENNEVGQLSRVFNRSRWDTADAIAAWVHARDPDVTHMSDANDRTGYRRDRYGISDEHHRYGQHLCWHAMLAVAGDYLDRYPVVRGRYDDGDPWAQWIKSYRLTHPSGLWLADGTDWRPIDTMINLREAGEDDVGITGRPERLLALVGINGSVGERLVVDAAWSSMDGVDVLIRSALVDSDASTSEAAVIAKSRPFEINLPRRTPYEDEEEDYDVQEDAPFISWIVSSEGDARLDGEDKLGASKAGRRARFIKEVNAAAGLTSADPFGRSWTDSMDVVRAGAEVWSQHPERSEDGRSSGSRLRCSTDLIKRVLELMDCDLLLHVVLQRYQAGYGSESTKFWHTTAVVRVTRSLDFTYFPGRINELQRPGY